MTGAAPRFVLPADWQRTGARPDLVLAWPGGSTPRIAVHRRDDWIAGHADRGVALAAAKAPLPDLWVARPGQALTAGDYVASASGDDGSGGGGHAAIGFVVAPELDVWETRFAKILAARVARTRAVLPALPARAAGAPPLFSIATTVFDTEPAFLDALAASITAQLWTDFEWLVLDNGSRSQRTMDALAAIARSDARVVLHRVDANIHIVPGNRFLLERTRGDYVVPVDSDDLLTEDALALFAERILGASGDAPRLLFTEEQKVSLLGRPIEPMWRPDWSRLHALATCPAAHVMAFARADARMLGVYTDDTAKGCHDWDTFLRLTDAGIDAVHIAEVAYGWRMHAASSAASEGAKDYLLASQRGTLQASLARRGLAARFEVEQADPPVLGYWHARRLPVEPVPMRVDYCVLDEEAVPVVEANLRALRDPNLRAASYPSLEARVLLACALPAGTVQRLARAGAAIVDAQGEGALAKALADAGPRARVKVIVEGHMRLTRADWPWEVLGTFELDPRTGICGGRIVDRGGALLHAGYVAGLDGFVGTPCFGGDPRAVPGFLPSLRRHVLAAHGGLLAVKCEVLARCGAPLGVDGDDGIFGLEYGLRCARAFAVGYAPGFEAQRARVTAQVGAGHGLRPLLQSRYARELAADAYYSTLLVPTSQGYGALRRDDGEPVAAAPHRGPLLQQIATSARRMAAQWKGRAASWVKRRQREAEAPSVSARDPRTWGETASGGWEPPRGLFPLATPLALEVDDDPAAPPWLNVLLPGVAMRCMSGGPNTILNLAYRMAARGVPVRIVATDIPLDRSDGPLFQHMMSLSGIASLLPNVAIVDGSDRANPVRIGGNDVFLASAWWTAQMIKYALPRTRAKKFIYVIQDYEPVLHEHSTYHALASETYGLDYVPIVNHAFLLEYLRTQKIGRFADPDFAARCAVLDAAIDRTRFHPEPKATLSRDPEPKATLSRDPEPKPADAPRRLLFYARPDSGKRNLFELGIAALQIALRRGAFQDGAWEFLGMGDPFSPRPLGPEHDLVHTPWRDFDGYAAQMRSADVLLSLMLSPHPSYPPLEMAACGGLVVTNTYANKTAERFAGISRNILAGEPTAERIADLLVEASRRVPDAERRRRDAAIAAPASWDESFEPVLPYALAAWRECQASGRGDGARPALRRAPQGHPLAAGRQYDIHQRYAHLRAVLHAFRRECANGATVSVLDIGAGPERLAEEYLGAGFAVSRTDVEIADDEVVVCRPGEPLPFGDRSFDVVLGLDVLEHVAPEQRDALVRDSARIARHLCVLTFPRAVESVRAAERALAELHASAFGHDHRFLAEHETLGLPELDLVLRALTAAGLAAQHVADNCLLAHWLLYSAVDTALVKRFGIDERKLAFNLGVNGDAPWHAGQEHYRQIVAAGRDAAVVAVVRRAAEALRSDANPQIDVARVVTALAEMFGSPRESVGAK